MILMKRYNVNLLYKVILTFVSSLKGNIHHHELCITKLVQRISCSFVSPHLVDVSMMAQFINYVFPCTMVINIFLVYFILILSGVVECSASSCLYYLYVL